MIIHLIPYWLREYHIVFDMMFVWLAKLTGGYYQAVHWKDEIDVVCAFFAGCLITFFSMNAILLRVTRSEAIKESSIVVVEAKGKKRIVTNPQNTYDMIDTWIALFKVIVLRMSHHIEPRNRILARIFFFIIVTILVITVITGFIFASNFVSETEYHNFLRHQY